MDVPKDQEKKMRDLFLTYQLKEQELKALQQQVEGIDGKMEEAAAVFGVLEDMGKAQSQAEMLVPISSGIFIKGKFLDASSLFVNVGSGVVVPKTMGEVKELINSQINEMQQMRIKIITEFEKQVQAYSKIEEDLKKLVG